MRTRRQREKAFGLPPHQHLFSYTEAAVQASSRHHQPLLFASRCIHLHPDTIAGPAGTRNSHPGSPVTGTRPANTAASTSPNRNRHHIPPGHRLPSSHVYGRPSGPPGPLACPTCRPGLLSVGIWPTKAAASSLPGRNVHPSAFRHAHQPRWHVQPSSEFACGRRSAG